MTIFPIIFHGFRQNNVKVVVCGASGGIGQPLSLLLKKSPLVTQLHLYDIVHTPGVAADLSHIDTPAVVRGFNGADNLDAALKGTLRWNHFNLNFKLEFIFIRAISKSKSIIRRYRKCADLMENIFVFFFVVLLSYRLPVM